MFGNEETKNWSMIKHYFQKAGGVGLLKQYWRAGVLHTAIIQFLLLGRSETALKLLRLIVSMKVQEKLKKKYAPILNHFDQEYKEENHDESRKVWIFWWQGMENAPVLVQKCYASVKEHLSGWEIILITENNYKQYATFPKHIIEKLKKGQITLTHFSDLLRLELLINHGGLWLDATVFCSGGNIPDSIVNSDLFVFRSLKPGADGRATVLSSWLMYAKTNNKILRATRELLYAYWERNTYMVDYFLIHQFFSIAAKRYKEEAKRIPPFCNSVPHILLLHLFDEYDEQYWNDLKRMTCFHKLSYKLDSEDVELKGTYYDIVMNT